MTKSINDGVFNPLSLYHCGHEQCKPAHSFGPAVRPHYLFHYILHGKGTYYVNKEAFKLEEGNGFLITPGVSTVYVADEIDPWEYCWIGFDGSEVKKVLLDCGLSDSELIFTDMSNGMLRDALLNLIYGFIEGRGNEYTYRGQLYICFSHMYTKLLDSSKLIYESHIVRALDYIRHNYYYDIIISDVAKYCSIDRTYLYKLFQNYKKLSPQQYLIRYRLNIAGELLINTDLNVTEIAYSCGFKDASSFNKHFKRYYNISPLKYRLNKNSIAINV